MINKSQLIKFAVKNLYEWYKIRWEFKGQTLLQNSAKPKI